MTRVLVVGSDIHEEQVLLARLRRATGLSSDHLRACRALSDCDLLVVRNTPTLRHAAMRMASQRPDMRLWVEDDGGQLHDGAADISHPLDDAAIRRVLCGRPAAEAVIDEPLLAHSAKPVTRMLRRSLQERRGHALLSVDGWAQLLIDFENDQAVVLGDALQSDGALAQRLAEDFPQAGLHALAAHRYADMAAGKPRLPLRPLLWQIGQYEGHWQDLDRSLQQGARIRLLRWPDFRVLGHQHDGFRLCSLLLKRACTLDECQQLLELDPATVRRFVHPAYLCGYATVEMPAGTSATAAPLPRNAGGSLLARMWRSVRERNRMP